MSDTQKIKTTITQQRVKGELANETTRTVATPTTEELLESEQGRVTQINQLAALRGPEGPEGPAGVGEPGPPGPAGPAGGTYTHYQNIASAVWVINHNLGFVPGGVRVEDSAGTDLEGDIVDSGVNSMTITFSAAFGGTAYLS